jgi:undecaprenyl-diphosphatase
MISVLLQSLLKINGIVFFAINTPAGHTPFLDTIMPFLAEDALYLFPVLVLILWWLPGGASPEARNERSRSREVVLWSILAVLVALGVNAVLGKVIYEPRPFVSWPRVDHQLVPHPADASFPSDHAAASFAIAGVLLLRLWMVWRPPAISPSSGAEKPPLLADRARAGLHWRTGILAALGLLLALAIGFARVYVGVHYPLDILGGAVIGLLVAWLMWGLRSVLRPLAQRIEWFAARLHLA